MSKRISVTLSDGEYEELKNLAEREKRTVNSQLHYILNTSPLLTPKFGRRAADQQQAAQPEPAASVNPDETHPVPPVGTTR